MIVFHHSPTVNRKSIQQNGLGVRIDRTGLYGIFLTDTPSFTKNGDTWSVDTTGIDLEPHHSGERTEEKWWVCYNDIPTSNIIRRKR